MKPERRPIVIEHVRPAVDDGRYPAKRVVGDVLAVSADIFKEGHDLLAARICYRTHDESAWREAPLQPVDNDGWGGVFRLEANTRYRYTVEAWTDTFGSWVQEMRRRIAGGQSDLASELLEGAAMVRRAQAFAGPDGAALGRALEWLAGAPPQDTRLDVLLDADLRQVMARVAPRPDLTRHDRELEVVVDRPEAAFAAWYEMFPRSQGRVPGRHGTFDDCIERLPDIRRMGFDVVYLPPIHPIGHTARKGPDNALAAGPGDPGSPWAIGSAEGGHTAVHPDLGTLEGFRRLVKSAQGLGLEIALDFAIQCSPDHPWVREHPEWFYPRPDGTIKYAENPPKKYQDIYPINFATEAWASLWDALLGVVRFWIEQGVRTFRVDNPHTKPLDFWAWLIRQVQERDPDVIFLSEAFTRPKVMRARATLAATLAAVWGVYSGFELGEAAALPGSEEYQASEKYEIRVRDWDAPGNLKDHIARLNTIRRENRALHSMSGLRFYASSSPHVLFYGKMTPARDNVILVAVNLDPFAAHETTLELPLEEIGIAADETYELHELLADQRRLIRGARHTVSLDPRMATAHVYRVGRWRRRERDFDYFA